MENIKDMTFEDYLQLQSVSQMPPINQNFAISKVEELIKGGLVPIEKYGHFQPKELLDDVMAICRELKLQISEYDREWTVARAASGVTVWLAMTDQIKPSWARSELYKPVVWD